jgi:hypothetical protein
MDQCGRLHWKHGHCMNRRVHDDVASLGGVFGSETCHPLVMHGHADQVTMEEDQGGQSSRTLSGISSRPSTIQRQQSQMEGERYMCCHHDRAAEALKFRVQTYFLRNRIEVSSIKDCVVWIARRREHAFAN